MFDQNSKQKFELQFADFVSDINEMHAKYQFHDWMREQVEAGNKEKLIEFLKFRFKFLQEEIDEGVIAIEEKDAEGVVDSIVDLLVVGIGSLDLFGINTRDAWQRVHEANMTKERGMKETRKNDFGAPDLIKPESFVSPNHSGNHGIIGHIFTAD